MKRIKKFKSEMTSHKKKVRKTRRGGRTFVPRTSGALAVSETKIFDTFYNTAVPAITTSWSSGIADPATFLCLCVPVVGAALNQRIGRRINYFKVKIRGQYKCAAQQTQAAAETASSLRIMLVVDKQTNAAQMTAAQLMAPDATTSLSLQAFQNTDNFGRFQVLKDKRHKISNANLVGSPTTGDVVQQGMLIPFKLNYTFKKPLSAHFNATNGGTIADIVDNSLHIVCACDNSSYAPTLQYAARVVYQDA